MKRRPRIPTQIQILLLAAMLIGLWHQPAMARAFQLPAETAIPGVPVMDPDRLPLEATLPGQSAVNRTLPSEAVLPPNASHRESRPIQNEAVPGLAKVDQDDEWGKEFSQRPLLRLLSRGPIAPVQSVCFSADSKRILAGGQDKALHVWRQVQLSDGTERWVYEKAVYWQIYRAARGQIFSVASGNNLIAFGGTGASAANGEIAIVDPRTLEFSRALFDLERGHLNPIHTVATNLENDLIASIDFDGRTISWRRHLATGRWDATVLQIGDSQQYDQPTRREIAGWRARGGGLAMSDSKIITYPEMDRPFRSGSVPSWHLVRCKQNGEKTVLEAPEPHRGMVAAIATSADGNRIVSADIRGNGRLFFWDLTRSRIASVIKTQFPIRCLSVSRNGRRIAIGTARNDGAVSQVQVLEWSKQNTIREIVHWNEKMDVASCAFDADATRLVYTQSDSVIVRSLDGQEFERLNSNLEPPYRVAFSERQGDYRIEIRDRESDRPQSEFDPNQLTLVRTGGSDRKTWMPSNPHQKDWGITVSNLDNGLESYAIRVSGKSSCVIPLDTSRGGSITHFTFVPDPHDPARPFGLILGTTVRNHVLAYRIAYQNNEASCKLLRVYRGHTAAVTCTGISADRRYLVSSSLDGTVRFWKLDGVFEKEFVPRELNDRWGTEFEVHDNKLIVSNIVNDGPLYFRGVRNADIIERISWNVSDDDQQILADPAQMLERLKSATTETMIRFDYRRGGVNRQFHLYPAWQPLASLVVNRDREWAFWTPYGYYDASFNGHKIFGWQINRGVNREVDFFRAAELKEEFEQPAMMQNLLTAGNVEDAFAIARMDLPNDLSRRLGAIGRLKPTVEIVRVDNIGRRDPDTTQLLARVELPDGVELGRVNAFANGVPAIRTTLLDRRMNGKNQVFDYRFKFSLPHDAQIKIQVLASSVLGHGAIAETMVVGPADPPKKSPRVFLMALGVSLYRDSQIPQLDFAHLNAEAILRSLTGPDLSKGQSVLLTGDEANKSMWMITSKSLAEQMKQVAKPDDLLVIFLSGHGFRDPVTGDYFYLTADSKFADVLSRRYRDCISIDDLHAFGDVACRKLVILDTCHSGALQGLRQHNLKSVVRTLENDMFFTLTASEGSQEAFELKQRGLGLFTSRLTDGMAGEADLPSSGGDGDGQVTLREIVSFLKSTVPLDAAQLGSYQFPTASPADLLELAEIRLTHPVPTPR